MLVGWLCTKPIMIKAYVWGVCIHAGHPTVAGERYQFQSLNVVFSPFERVAKPIYHIVSCCKINFRQMLVPWRALSEFVWKTEAGSSSTVVGFSNVLDSNNIENPTSCPYKLLRYQDSKKK